MRKTVGKTFVVTGGAGFIGSNFVEELLRSGNRVVVIDKFTYASKIRRDMADDNWRNSDEELYSLIRCDINDLDRLPDCDYVVNFAAETHVDNSIYNQATFMKTNILGVEHLLQLIKAKSSFNRPIFVQISTDEVYSDNPPKKGFKEDAVLNPSSPYSASKASADQLVMGYSRTFGLEYFIIRPTNNFGADQYPEKIISKNLRHLDRGEKMIMYGTGENKRTWLHVEDCVYAIIKVLQEGTINNIYNVSGDIVLENREVLRVLCEAYLGHPVTEKELLKNYVTVVPNRLGEDVMYAVNDKKLRSLGWRPIHTDFDGELINIVDHNKDFIKNWI